MKRQKTENNFSFFKFILSIIAALLVLLCIFAIVVFFNYKPIVKQIFDRDLTLSKISYNTKTGSIDIDNLKLDKTTGENLFSAEKISIIFDLKKTILLRPTIKNITIEKPETFIIHEESTYKIPDFFPVKKNKQKNSHFNISINGIFVKNGAINLLKDNKLSKFITNIVINLPEIGTDVKYIKPEISGYVNNKLFKFSGETILKDDGSISNVFKIKINRLDLYADKLIIPVIPGFILKKGVTDLNAVFKYNIDKNKKTKISLNGSIYISNLTLTDSDGKKIIEKMTGFAAINNYDISSGIIDIEKLSISDGYFKMPMLNGKKNKFSFDIKNLSVNKIAFEYKDYKLNNVSGVIKNISNKMENVTLDISGTLQNGGDIYVNGKNNSTGFVFSDIQIKSVDPYNIPNFSKLDYLDSIYIDNFSGNGNVTKNGITISGTTSLSKIKYKNKNGLLSIDNVSLIFENLSTTEKSVVIKKIDLSSGDYSANNGKIISDIALNGGNDTSAININLLDKKDFSGEFPVSRLTFTHSSWDRPYKMSINDSNITYKFNNSDKGLVGSSIVNIGSVTVLSNEILTAKLSGLNCHFDKITNTPLRLNISKINADYIYSKFEILKDMSVVFGGVINLTGKKKTTGETTFLHISEMDIKDGDLSLHDNHLADPILFDFTNISFKLTNFPSYIYPSGKINVKGMVDTVNPFEFDASVSKVLTEGKFTGNGFLLFRLSPYTEYYLKHKITDGKLDIYIPFVSDTEKTALSININLKKPVIHKTSPLFTLNLVSIFSGLEERDGSVKLALPVEINKSKTNINFFAIVFDVFKNTVRLTADKFVNPITSKLIYDNFYSLVYFKSGSSELNDENILSDTMVLKIADENVLFSIRGFVDKNSDSEYIKREIIKKLVKKYNDSEKKTIYENILKNEFQKDFSLDANESDLFDLILKEIIIKQEDYYALAYSRATASVKVLKEKYNIPEKRIFIEEDDIFNNPYISGITNDIAVIRTGKTTK